MPEFSRTAKRRHTFAFVSTRLPLFLHSLRYNNGGEPVRPSFFPFFFSFLLFLSRRCPHESNEATTRSMARPRSDENAFFRPILALWLKFVDRPVCTPRWTAFDNHPRAFFLVLSSLGIN